MAITLHNKIAATDVSISPLTLGTVKFGRNQSVKYPGSFDLPNDNHIQELLSLAYDNGITTLDTAPAYGISEERIGELLTHRQKWQIISKAGETYNPKDDSSHYDYSVKALNLSLENTLKKLNTDYLDCWLLHSDGNDVHNMKDEVIDVFIKAKERGLVRSIGASTKTVEGGQKALQHFDCIMMSASLSNTSESALFDIAKDAKKSLLMKKVFDSGWALTSEDTSDADKKNIMQQTFSSLFQHPAVTSAVVGTINPKHIIENINALQASMSERS